MRFFARLLLASRGNAQLTQEQTKSLKADLSRLFPGLKWKYESWGMGGWGHRGCLPDHPEGQEPEFILTNNGTHSYLSIRKHLTGSFLSALNQMLENEYGFESTGSGGTKNYFTWETVRQNPRFSLPERTVSLQGELTSLLDRDTLTKWEVHSKDRSDTSSKQGTGSLEIFADNSSEACVSVFWRKPFKYEKRESEVAQVYIFRTAPHSTLGENEENAEKVIQGVILPWIRSKFPDVAISSHQ